jgi:hypothetical protein
VNAAPHFQIGGATRNLQAKSKPDDHLSVVCFGASAGGFEAYCTILSLLPADTGMAYIIVHHQAADGKSLLVEILPRVCPHLGGIVSWNDAENMWGCPAHGSQFDPLGTVLNGPANEDLHSTAVAAAHE